MVGEEAVIPCHLRPPTDAQSMEVRWHRTHLTGLVHHYRNGQDATEQQSLEYQGRTQLLRDNITRGYVALRIHPIHPLDEGEYRCSFISSGEVKEAQFNVLVTASGAPPVIHAEPVDMGTIRLTCSSTGWYPEPEVQWKNQQGLRLAPASETMSVEDGLFYVETSVIVREGMRGDVWCLVRNTVLSVEKEARVSVAGNRKSTVVSEEEWAFATGEPRVVV
ncbi:butyrophilin subfamily 3 member A2-like [Ctenodactylus gundi]